MRKPVAAIPTETEYGPSVVVICDDGAVFELQEETIKEGRHWKQYPSVPGTQESSDQTKEEFLVLATRFFREHLEASRAPEGGEAMTGPTREGEAAHILYRAQAEKREEWLREHPESKEAREAEEGAEAVREAPLQPGEPIERDKIYAVEMHGTTIPEGPGIPPSLPFEGEAARARENLDREVYENAQENLDRVKEARRLESKAAKELLDAPQIRFREPGPLEQKTAQELLDAPRFFCASLKCPGYPFKASTRSHPEDVCGIPERHLDRPEPAGAVPADGPPFFCSSPKCQGYPWKASERPHTGALCKEPGSHLDRPEPPYRGAEL